MVDDGALFLNADEKLQAVLLLGGNRKEQADTALGTETEGVDIGID